MASPLFDAPYSVIDLFIGIDYDSEYWPAVALGDLNGDGRPDLVAASPSGERIVLRLGNVDGSFGEKRVYGTESAQHGVGNVVSVAIGTLDGDDYPDVAVTTMARTVAVWLGNGDGSFGTSVSEFFTDHWGGFIEIGDLNGDGGTDLLVGRAGDQAPPTILFGRGDGTFQDKTDLAVAGVETAAIADLNGDGRLDLVVGQSPGSASVLLGNGDGSFQAPRSYPTGQLPISVEVGDFDRDGNLDLAVACRSSRRVSVLLGAGDGTFGPQSDHRADARPALVTAGDLTGDGTLDLAVANDSTGSVSILVGDGRGGFGPPANYPDGFESPRFLSIADLDGEGHPEILVGNAGQVAVLGGREDGSFGNQARLPVPPGSGFVETADVNGDGHSDIISISYLTCLATLFLGDGAGNFVRGSEFTVGFNPTSLRAVDLNADGWLDLVIANSGAESISVLLNLGNGRFAERYDYQSDGGAYVVALGDVNNDGWSDMAAGGSYRPVLLYLGAGEGSFAWGRAIAGAKGGLSTALADLDNDGRLDLITSPPYALSVQLGHGDGTFEVPSEYPIKGAAFDMQLVDVNNDDRADIVVANEGDKTVQVLLGRGDGTFDAAVSFNIGIDPNDLAVADLNGDRRADIATVNSRSRSISVLLGHGDGSFAQQVVFGTGDQLVSIAVADLNGDALPDLAAGAFLGDHISLLWNRSSRPQVEVAGFRAESTAHAVHLYWTLSLEVLRGLRSVYIERADDGPDGRYVQRTRTPLAPARSMSFEDLDLEPGSTYWYRLALDNKHGVEVVSRPLPVATADAGWRTSLDAVPFLHDGQVRISYRIGPRPAATSLAVFDVGGRQVRLLVDQQREPGSYIRTWDCRDDAGRHIARGVYIVRLRTGEATASRKLLVAHN